MKIGTTFDFEGNEYSIKSIDMDDPDKKRFPTGRLNASKFKGEGPYRVLQAGRPKAFDLKIVADILGHSINSVDVVENIENATIPIEISSAWDKFSNVSEERVDEILDFAEDKSVDRDWGDTGGF